jgi:glycosyltransferase involved in cell wall biosynthesis
MVTVGLVMICKNEEHIILRCLESCQHHVDVMTIVDTGSTDKTKELVRAFIKKHNIKGSVLSRKWIDFGHNRTQAIRLAEKKTDYILMLDADMILNIFNNDWKQHLTKDQYLIKHQLPGLTQYLPLLYKSSLSDNQWIYQGKTHEFLDSFPSSGQFSFEVNNDIEVIEYMDGSSRSHKFSRDIQLLEDQLKETTDTHLLARTWFYLGQSYENQGLDYKKAINCYQKRIDLKGWIEEVAYCHRRIAHCYQKIQNPWQYALEQLLFSYSLTPQRAEPLIDICSYYRLVKKWNMCYYYASLANTLPRPKMALFIEDDVYNWRIKDELAIAAYWIGQYEQSYVLNQELLNSSLTPSEQKDRIKTNMEYSKNQLGK